jgi:O-antigen ligase
VLDPGRPVVSAAANTFLPRARAGAADCALAAPILVAFALFATKNLVHYPVALMSLLGLWQMVRAPRALFDPASRALLLLFALVWLPMLCALPDASDPARTAKTVWLYVHLLPASYYLMRACARPTVFSLVTQGVVILVVFIGLDAFAQLIWGENLFGYAYDGRVLKGVFHPKQRLGLFLAVFAPLCIVVISHWSRKFPRLWLLYVPLLIVLLMSLKRSAWVMFVAGLGGFFALGRGGASMRHQRRGVRLLPLVLIAAVVVGAVLLNPSLRAQFGTVAGLLSGDAAQFDRASSYRLTLWRTGVAMFEDNWLNGVGPRGYRQAYRDYAAADDFWLARQGSGQTHTHLLVLEVAAETGIIGLLGLAAFYGVLIGHIRRLRKDPGAVWLLCAAVAWLPVNAHLAFYGSFWSTLVWMLLSVGCGALARESLSLRSPADDAPAAP